VEISLSPLDTEDGILVSSAIRDITERKRFEQALQEKNVELENANRAKDRFLASMSHELRTPLNSILGFTGTLLMKLPGPLNTDQERQLRIVQSSAKHLLALINDLLDLAKIEAGKLQLDLQPVDCKALLEEVAASLRPQAVAKGLELRITVPPEEIVLLSDRRALGQIVINLVNNAIKFTEFGEVHVRMERHAASGRRDVEISVQDTGVGIAAADQERLFSAFTRVRTPEHEAYEGTGLGLYLSRKLADALGGWINCQSDLGKGSQFTVLIPEGE
jgi:protein-histidine pros-kinase